MATAWVYILLCADGSYYVGSDADLDLRLAQHKAGDPPGWTTRRRPVALVYTQEMGSRTQALEAEWRIKRWSRAKKEALIRCDYEALHWFAKKPRFRPKIQRRSRP